MNKNNPYGYKVGHQDSRLFIRKFISRTHKQAYQMLLYYRKYGHKRTVQRFNYEIQPITKKEVLAGIWDELPFSTVITTIPYKFPFRHEDRSIGQTRKSKTAEKLFRFSQLFSFIKTFSLLNFDFRENHSSHTCPTPLTYATTSLPKVNLNL